jgi:hypothetical protein
MSISAHNIRIPGCATSEQAERFMAAAAAKVQGSPPAAQGPAEILQQIAPNAGRVASADTPEAVAAFVASVGTRARSVAAPAPAATPGVAPAAGPDMETPESVAAFVLSAGRRTSRPA